MRTDDQLNSIMEYINSTVRNLDLEELLKNIENSTETYKDVWINQIIYSIF